MYVFTKTTREGVIDPNGELTTIRGHGADLQNKIMHILSKLLGYWLRGNKGLGYLTCLEEDRASRTKHTRLSIHDVEGYFGFTHTQYRAIWYPIQFVVDSGFWSGAVGPNANKSLYQSLRIRTIVMIVRIIMVLTTGKVNHRVISNSVKLRILDASACRTISEWPVFADRAKRP